MEGEDDLEHGSCAENCPRSQSPFSHFRARAAYLRKSISADDHLDMGSDYSCGAGLEGKSSRGTKGKLKRKFVSSILLQLSAELNEFIIHCDCQSLLWQISNTFLRFLTH